MPRNYSLPSSTHLCKFVECFFAGRQVVKDTTSKGSHIVYRIPSHQRNISIPRNRQVIKPGTFEGILEDIGITSAAYAELAATPKLLKDYCKHRQAEADGRP